jgi:hypothetical protein
MLSSALAVRLAKLREIEKLDGGFVRENVVDHRVC